MLETAVKRPRKGTPPGPKPPGYVKPQSDIDLQVAQTRLTSAKADAAELDHKISTGEYVSRSSVRQASATAMQTLSQSLRSIRDNLERRGISVEVAHMVDEQIEATLNDIADKFQEMAGEE